jgi:hypothetical protein
MVSSREVAVMMWDEPAVREVYRYSVGSAMMRTSRVRWLVVEVGTDGWRKEKLSTPT